MATDGGRDTIARMDRIPIRAFPTSLLLIIGNGYFFTFFDTSDIGFAMPSIAASTALSPAASSELSSLIRAFIAACSSSDPFDLFLAGEALVVALALIVSPWNRADLDVSWWRRLCKSSSPCVRVERQKHRWGNSYRAS